jgi:hypothetical protein
MKKNLILLMALFFSTVFYAQTKGIAYQAVIYNPNGRNLPGVPYAVFPLSNSTVCLQFSFLDGMGDLEYKEQITTKTDEFGIVNVIIGTGSPIGGYAGSFSNIKWDTIKMDLAVELDITGECSSFVEISKEPFTTAPFSFSAITANNVSGIVAVANGGTGSDNVVGAKINLGLGNVDNTSDLLKPISTATQLGLNLKEDAVNKSNDIISDASSIVKFPSVKAIKDYVDNQIIPDATTVLKGKVQLAGDLSGTADLPTIAVGAITDIKIANGISASKVGLGNVDNTSDMNKPLSAATTTALNGKLDKNLVKAETIATSSTNTLAITGLQNETSTTNQLVSINPTTGVLSRIDVPTAIVAHELVYTAAASDTQFTTPVVFTDIAKVNVYRNGIRIGATMVDATHIQLEAGVICNDNDEIRIVQYE